MAKYADSDPYVDIRTGVLRNLLGCRTQEELDRAEAEIVYIRMSALGRQPVPGRFDSTHLRAIHKLMFGPIYDWAGQFRTVGISRDGSMFCAPAHIESSAIDLFKSLARESFLARLDQPAFTGRAAHYLGELNALHPFREGNGRTQREFIRTLALHNGFEINWEGISQTEMTVASIAAFHGKSQPLADLIAPHILPAEPYRQAIEDGVSAQVASADEGAEREL